MQLMIYDKQNSTEYHKDNIVFLPIIDLYPGDMSCIYSTLSFLSTFGEKYKKPSIITFDQPLYWKANKIVTGSSELHIQKIVLLLGSFHTVMNLLGCAGTLMEGSGLSDILGEIYGENAVVHMLTGKAYSRALRDHIIIDHALSKLLIDKVDDASVGELGNIYDEVIQGNIEIDEIKTNSLFEDISIKIENTKKNLISESRTSRLWIEYQHIDIIKKYIKADRLGMWNLHLEALKESLPIFAAAGHFNLSNLPIYTFRLLNLETTNYEVFQYF